MSNPCAQCSKNNETNINLGCPNNHWLCLEHYCLKLIKSENDNSTFKCTSKGDYNACDFPINKVNMKNNDNLHNMYEEKKAMSYLKKVRYNTCPTCHNHEIKANPKDRNPRRECGFEGCPDFCAWCNAIWNKGNGVGVCGNGCTSDPIFNFLSNTPFVNYNCYKDDPPVIVEMPLRRLCPDCDVPIEHGGACKHMTCGVCSCEFCFLCLRKKVGDKWPIECKGNMAMNGAYNYCETAPTQSPP